MTFEEKLELAREFNKKIVAGAKASKISIDKMIKADQLDTEDMESLVSLYPKYKIGVAYGVDTIFQYEVKLYKVIQAHTSQADWIPSKLPALYLGLMPSGVIPEFVQPTGAHDSYGVGDKVLFQGSVYESLINGNSYNPIDYPSGWKLVEQ